MKILWFTNSPCSASSIIGTALNTGGWLRSLEEEIASVPQIELAICFYSYKYHKPFRNNYTQFFPVLRLGKMSKISRYIKRLFFSENDDYEIKEQLKVIELFKPNLIHIHGTEDNFGMVQYFTDIPVVISIQGVVNSISEKYFSGVPFSFASHHESILYKIALASVKYNYRQIKRTAEREQKILKKAKYIIGRTDLDKRITNILAHQSMYFLGNEMLRSAFYNNTWSKLHFDNTIQIMTITSGGFYKGFDTIVRTAQILKENSNLKFIWKVIGLNEKSYIVKVVKKWENVNFSDINIQFLGYKDEKGIIETMLQSDIYCQTSHIENSPNSLCEAMILGMPIIASFSGGTSSLLKDKTEGILIQDGDSYSFAGEIISLSSNFQAAIEYGNAARTRALQRHNHKLVRDEYLEIYKLIIEEV